MSHPTPTRHGNWHVIDGQLVDLDAAPAPAAAPTPEPAAEAAEAAPAAGRAARRRTASTQE